MAEFGEELRAEREGRGISLEQLCASTKVNPRHFEALEQGNYLLLPGGVFRRGIFRAYLAGVGLEEENWLPRFDASVEAQARASGTPLETDSAAWARFAENVRRSRPTRREPTAVRWIGVLLLLCLVAAAAWLVWRYLLQHRLI
jgi:cytoskeletal protein RodZ